jgi:hypothetical protein
MGREEALYHSMNTSPKIPHQPLYTRENKITNQTLTEEEILSEKT